jgi:hypothetical protein
MTPGATYVSVIAALRQEDLHGGSLRRQRTTVRRHDGQTLAARIRRAFHAANH